MDRATYDALPLGTEFTTRHACPVCGHPGMEGVIKLIADKNASLAGTQLKVSCHRGAMLRCTACGAEREGEPK